MKSTGAAFLSRLSYDDVFLSVGIASTLCATTAAEQLSPERGGFFLSGLARTYMDLGFPDVGHLEAETMVRWARAVKRVVPEHHLIVDIDEGFGPVAVAKRVLADLRGVASAVQYDDQDPMRRKCGHLAGKVVVPLAEQLDRLEQLLSFIGDEVLVIARTDSPSFDDALFRAKAFSHLGAPIVLVDGLDSPEKIARVRDAVLPGTRIMFNYIQGGRSAPLTASDLGRYGGDILNFSVPFLLTHVENVQRQTRAILESDGLLECGPTRFKDVVGAMDDNYARFEARMLLDRTEDEMLERDRSDDVAAG